MNIKRVLTVTLIFLLVFIGLTANAEKEKISSKVQKMINAGKKLKSDEAIDLYKSFNNDELNEFQQYLEKNPDALPPIYFVMIADKVYETDKDKAVFFYNFGKIRASEDVRMCKDSSARQQLMIYSMMAPNTVSYMQSKGTDFVYMNNMFNKIIDWDIIYNNRVNPIWACYHGISAFSQKPELLPKEEFVKIQKETHDNLKGLAEIIKKMNEQARSNTRK